MKSYIHFSFNLFLILLFFQLLISCSTNTSSDLINKGIIEIVEQTHKFNHNEDFIEVDLFLKNNGIKAIKGEIYITLNFLKTKEKRLEIFQTIDEDVLKIDSLITGLKGESSYMHDLYEKESKELSEVKNKIEEAKLGFKSDTSKTKELNIIIIKQIEINAGGLVKINFNQPIPNKFMGYKDISYLDSIYICDFKFKNNKQN